MTKTIRHYTLLEKKSDNMGCDLCVLTPAEDGKYDIGWAYSTFNMIRGALVQTALDLEEDVISKTPDAKSTWEDISAKLKQYGYDGLNVLWNHSDCDGDYSTEDATMIAKDIEEILPYVNKDISNMVEALYDMFKYASENDGIIMVW